MIENKLRELRIESGLSQNELARKLKCSRTTIAAWESGLSQPTAKYIIKLCKIYCCTADYLLELEKNDSIVISNYSKVEKKLIKDLLSYIESNNK